MNENDNNQEDSVVTENGTENISHTCIIFCATIIKPSINTNDSTIITIPNDKPLISNQSLADAVPVQVVKSEAVVVVSVSAAPTPTDDIHIQLQPEQHGFNYFKRKYIILDRHHNYLHNQPDFYQIEE